MAFATTHRHMGTRTSDDHDASDQTVIDRSLQRREYGGFHLGSAFFGWLVSTGIATILTSILAAAGSAVAVSKIDNTNSISSQTATTVGLVSGILLLIVLAISYYAGGYVAGRMSRFDGARQGVGVWFIGFIIMLLLAGAGAALGAKYNILQQLNLPNLPVNGSSFTRGGLITTIAALVITLLAAILGGKVGEGFHRKVDATGDVDTAVE
jgi:amino acid transporter